MKFSYESQKDKYHFVDTPPTSGEHWLAIFIAYFTRVAMIGIPVYILLAHGTFRSVVGMGAGDYTAWLSIVLSILIVLVLMLVFNVITAFIKSKVFQTFKDETENPAIMTGRPHEFYIRRFGDVLNGFSCILAWLVVYVAYSLIYGTGSPPSLFHSPYLFAVAVFAVSALLTWLFAFIAFRKD